MSEATPRLSDKPYYADITFRDGTRRTVDYHKMLSSTGVVTFMSSESGEGPLLIVMVDAVQSIECFDSAIPKGNA